MDLATVKINIEGDSKSFDRTVDMARAKLKDFAGSDSSVKLDADGSAVSRAVSKAKQDVASFSKTKASVKLDADGSAVTRSVSKAKQDVNSFSKTKASVKLDADGSAVTRSVSKAKQDVASFSKTKASVRLDADASGVTAAVASAKRAIDSIPNQTNAVINVSERGAAATATALGTVKQQSDALNGQNATVNVGENGAASTAAALGAVAAESRLLNGQSINIPFSMNAAQGAQQTSTALRGLAVDMRAIAQVTIGAGIAALIAGLGAIPAVASAASAGILGLVQAIGSGLVGAAAAGGSAIGLLAGAVGLLAPSMGILSSHFQAYQKDLNASSGASDAAGASASQYQNALDSLAGAQEGLASAQQAATDKVDGAMQAYNDSLDQVASAQRALEDAQTSAADASQAAVDSYNESLQGVADAENKLDSARGQLDQATRDLAQAQTDLNTAMRDEPLNQADAALSLADAELSAKEATQGVADAQERLNEVQSKGDASANDIADAQLAVERAQLSAEKSTVSLGKSQNEYNDTVSQGSDELQNASKGYESALQAQQDAEGGVVDAEGNVVKALSDSDKAYANISKTGTQGARSIEEAQISLAKAQEESGRKYDDIAKAQVDGQKQVDAALRQVDQAQRGVTDAANKMAAANDKAAGATLNMSEAEKALFDRFIAFKQQAADAFQPATDQLAMLGIKMMDLAQSYFPMLAPAAEATAIAVSGAFDTIAAKLAEPAPQSAIQTILDYIPGAAGIAATAAGDLGIGLLEMFSRAVPYGYQLLEAIGGLASSFEVWATSAEGVAWIDSTLASMWDTATRLWGVVVDLGTGFANLFSSISGAGITEQMLGGLESMASWFAEVTTEGTNSRQMLDDFMAAAGPILSAIGNLVGVAVQEFFRMAYAVSQIPSDTPGMSLIEEVVNGIADSLPGVADSLIAMFQNLGPPIADLLPHIAGIFSVLAENSDILGNTIQQFSDLLDMFLGLPQPVQDFIVRAAEFLIIWKQMNKIKGALSGYVNDLVWSMGGFIEKNPEMLSAMKTLGQQALGLGRALGPLAAISLIAIDIVYHWPDIKEAFSTTYADAREGGDGVASSFMQALSAGINQTTIGSTIFAAVDWIKSFQPDITVWDVLMGNATQDEAAASGNIIAKLANVWDAANGYLMDLTPGASLLDVLMGNSTMQEAADGGNLGAKIILGIQSAWTAASEFIDGLVPTKTLWDVITGDATLQESADSGSLASKIVLGLQGAWTSASDFISGLEPTVTLWDVIMGNGTLQDSAEGGGIAAELILKLQEAWTGVTDWMANLAPEGTLIDKILEWDPTAVATKLGELGQQFLDEYETLKTSAGDFFMSLYNDYWLYYLGSDGVVATAVGDFFTSLYDTYWAPYFGTDGSLMTLLSDFFTFLWDSYWLYYFGTDGTLLTGVSDFVTYLVDTYWTPYFGTDGWLLTTITDFFTYLVDTYWTPYFGTDGWLLTTISDFLTYLTDTYWTPYFGTDGSFITAISDFLTYLVDTYWTPYFGTDGYLVTGVQEGWDTIMTGVGDFVAAFEADLGNGIKAAINTAIGWLQGLLDAVDSVLTAINVSPLGVTLPLVGDGSTDFTPSSSSKAEGGSDPGNSAAQMAAGGARGGRGHQGRHEQTIKWDEANGREWWIATKGPRGPNTRYLAGAAEDMGYGIVPNKGRGNSTRRPGGARDSAGVPARPSRSRDMGGVHNNPRSPKGLHAGKQKRMKDGGSMGPPVVRYMSIGGGTDLGPGGLSGEAAQIAEEVMSQFGVWANTYTGDYTPAEHGSLHGNTHENTFDFWADSSFDPLDYDTGYAIEDYVFGKYGGDLDTVIWQGAGTGPNGAFYDDDHYDHLHMSVGGSGLTNTAGVIASAVFNMAKKIWDAAMSALGASPDMGDGALWDGIETYLGTLPSQAWSYLTSLIPRGWGAAKGAIGGLTGDIQEMLQQGINAAGWSQADLDALIEIWGNRESGFDPNAVNPDSGAYGIPQINPASWGYPVPLGDAAAQIEWGMNYIADRYGTPSAALDAWNTQGWYEKGGVVPGRMGAPTTIGAHGGERVLPADTNKAFEDLANAITTWSDNGGDAVMDITIPSDAYNPVISAVNNTGKGVEVVGNEIRSAKEEIVNAINQPTEISDSSAQKIGGAAGGAMAKAGGATAGGASAGGGRAVAGGGGSGGSNSNWYANIQKTSNEKSQITNTRIVNGKVNREDNFAGRRG